MRQHVVYILDLSMTLTFDLYAGGGGYPYWVLLTVFILFILEQWYSYDTEKKSLQIDNKDK